MSLALLLGLAVAAPGPELTLTTAAEVRDRPSGGPPAVVRLRGVVLYADPEHLFAHDLTGGVYVSPPSGWRPPAAGRTVEVDGTADADIGEGFVRATAVRDLGPGTLPPPVAVATDRLHAGRLDCTWTEIEGRIEDVGHGPTAIYARVEAAGRTLSVGVRRPPGPPPVGLLGATVRVRGAVGSIYDDRGHFLRPHLHVPGPEFVTVVRPGIGDVSFDKPVRPIAGLSAVTGRPKVAGAVTFRAGDSLAVQDGTGAVWVRADPGQPGRPGESVEAIGTPTVRGGTSELAEAWVSVRGVAEPPVPVALDPNQPAPADAVLAAATGRVAGVATGPGGWDVWLVAEGGPATHARYAGPDLPPGGLVSEAEARLTGVYDAAAGRLLLRTAGDAVVLAPPPVPWWTPARLAMAGGGATAIALAAAGWVVALRVRVRSQTAQIRRQLEAERRLEARYQELFEHAGDAVVVTDGAGAVVAVNRAAERLFGVDRAALTGRPAGELLPAAKPAGPDGGADTTVTVGGGPPVPVEVSWRPLPGGGAQAVVRDLTARRRLVEQALRVQKLEAVGRLAGGIAHEFNNLLAVVSGYAELLRDTLTAADGRALAEGVMEASERAAGLTRQLQLFARQRAVAPAAVDLRVVVSGAADRIRSLAGPEVVVAIEADPAAPPAAADPDLVEQLLLALAANARDAMPRGGTLTVRAGAASGGAARLTVADTGVGMPPEVRARVFEPFFTTKGLGQGTGLGLAAVYGIVQTLGGEVRLGSEVGRGTTVEIDLPAAA
jgi:signal transduction histidine kinase